MPFPLSMIVYGVVLPAIVAAVLSRLLRPWRVSDFGRRLANSLPFVAGFHAGYWPLALGRATPESHWEWLPWVLLFAWAGALSASSKRMMLLRYAVVLGVVVASSWVLVPDWSHLVPDRPVWVVMLVTSVVLIAALMEPLTIQLRSWKLLSMLVAVLTSAAVILVCSGNVRFAQMAGCAVAAMAGLSLSAFFDRHGSSAVGIALPFALFIVAIMMIGRLNSFSDVPLASYVLPPLAPLTLWLTIRGPTASSVGVRRVALWSTPLVVCGVAVLLAAAA